ncbi:MAG: glycosyltransferase [Methylococcaceae bacterium]|nr:glycosyltransferase [Methylococcaceae bacterium]
MNPPYGSNRKGSPPGSGNLYILMISVHGLIRGRDLELGRDADTGGQTLYVVELIRALAELPEVARVDLMTRRVVDPQVDADYAQVEEILCPKSRIVRIDAGPEAYIHKEELWDHLDSFADNALSYMKSQDRLPHLVHSHYADAGYVGSRLASLLGRPLVHTGHSLGRVKRQRLLASGVSRELIETQYQMARRVEAEEIALGSASRVVVSSTNEIDEQYGLYDHYQPERMCVIPPGTDLQRFKPPDGSERDSPYVAELARFLKDPDKPMILALSRADERKNIASLIQAYGESSELQNAANLVLVIGNRDDIRDLDTGSRKVMSELLLDIDRYDLYGRVAYPKHHQREDIHVLYRLAAASHGVFINPALTDPFGLTLIEAAASGLPIVATEDGGPQDIVRNCQNGFLVDPLDTEAIGHTLLKVLRDHDTWATFSASGLQATRKHYTWQAHASEYLKAISPLIEESRASQPVSPPTIRTGLYQDRAIFTTLDRNLLGDTQSLEKLISRLRRHRQHAIFGIATARSLSSAVGVMRRYRIPMPDILISGMGSQILYAPELEYDQAWRGHIDHLWAPDAVRAILRDIPGLTYLPKHEQGRFNISYNLDAERVESLDEIRGLLRQADQTVNVTLSYMKRLDVLPIRASKGLAVRWCANRLGIPLERILVAGGSGADEDMMRGNTLAVVVENRRHDELITTLADVERVYFAKAGFAQGILEAMDYYDFYGACEAPSDEAMA